MGSIPSNPASLPMLAHIAGDRIMAASHALSLLPQISRALTRGTTNFRQYSGSPLPPVEETGPLIGGVAGIKNTPSNMSGSLSQDNASLLSLAKTPINIQFEMGTCGL